jgi:hypothetical protein
LKNQFVEARTAKDIDRQVERILHGLGNPEPPLNLELVRELLKLDRRITPANQMAHCMSSQIS